MQAQGLESKDINAQISNQNNVDDLHETLACLSAGFIYSRNRGDQTQHFKTVESYPQENGGINDKPEENAELEDVRIKVFLRQVFHAPVMKCLLIHNLKFFSILLTFSLFFVEVTLAHLLGRSTYPTPPPPDILNLLQICI